jgi:hypothetical protein
MNNHSELCRLPSWLHITVCCLVWLIGARVHAQALPPKKIGNGAVISVRGPTKALVALGAHVAERTLPTARIENLAPGIIFVDARLPSIRAKASQEIPHSKLYSRRNNPCKRAKLRKFIASLPQRVRCEPNWEYQATLEPNDPGYPEQYARSFLSLSSAWDQTTGSNEQIAVVIDSGVQYTHPDLAANMWTNPNEIAANGIDDDGNGYIDDIHGINAITGSGNPMDDNGHGTHCAGILGARGNNGAGIAGVAWNTKIIGAKFLASNGSGYLSDAIEAINYSRILKLAGHNIVVSNNSWGGGGYSASMYSAIQQSTAAGILFVAAAGNSTNNNDASPAYPASYNLAGILSVASTDNTGQLSGFSNYGATAVDIGAPGSDIVSCYPTDSYAYLSGTSMAAPQVSGIALLAQSICNGALNVSQMKEAILTSGVSYPALSGLVATGAIANAAAAISAANGICNATATPTNTPTSTLTATATPTDTPLPPEPTSTPQPDPPTPVPPTPTFQQGGGSGPPGRFRIRFDPDRRLSSATQVTISVDNAGDAQVSSLLLVGTDLTRRAYSCPRIRVPLTDGAGNLVVTFPDTVNYFRSLSIVASAGRANAKDSATVATSRRPKNFRQGQALFREVCSALKQAAQQ